MRNGSGKGRRDARVREQRLSLLLAGPRDRELFLRGGDGRFGRRHLSLRYAIPSLGLVDVLLRDQIGQRRVVLVGDFLDAIDTNAQLILDNKAPLDQMLTPQGVVDITDIADTTRDFGWTPRVTVDEGIPKFVEWFKAYNRL